jgi:hypothetical protein
MHLLRDILALPNAIIFGRPRLNANQRIGIQYKDAINYEYS